MNKFICHRVLPFICTFLIIVSLMVPVASAAGIGVDENLDTDSVAAWQSAVGNDVTDFVDEFASFLGVPLTKSAVFWRIMDGTLGTHLGEMGRDTLELVCTRLNNAFGSTPIDKQFSGLPDSMRTWFGMTLNDLMGFGTMHFEVQYPSGTAGYYRIVESISGIPVVTSRGMYPCTLHESVSSEDGAPTGCKFVPISYLKDKVHMMPYESLYNLGQDYGLTPMKYDKYWILKKSGTGATDFVLADANSYPCVARYDVNQWASNQDRPQTEVKDEVGEIVEGVLEGINTGIDLESMLLTLPDGSLQFIDELIYDSFNQTYNIDSHDTYNIENNFYFEYNFSWTYHVTHTSITYIGQTEEYDKYYEVYYELPDGRNSADLTKEDLEQLNLSIDVVPYGRSADDTSLRSLYHFDGDTHDESYWNYCTDFVWNTGASLTYMDAGTFNGALYLDENDHNFDVLLPSDIGTGDFTLQFRYYQSHTPAASHDSFICFGDSEFCWFTGEEFGWDSIVCSVIPTGTWNEIAFMREDGILYYYLNGVCYGSRSESRFFSYELNFNFGSTQQTYKYFDELRVLDYALVSNGENYAPSAVPHDTNLTLVLPDSTVPVADEFWDIDTSGTNLINGDFSAGELPEDFQTTMGSFPMAGQLTSTTLNQLGISSTSDVTLNVLKNYTLVTQNIAYTSTGSSTETSGKFTYSSWHGGLFTPVTLTSVKRTSESYSAGYPIGTNLTIAVLLNDGSVYQCTAPAGTVNSVSFDGGTIGFDVGTASTGTSSSIVGTNLYFGYVAPDVGSSLEIVYVELIEGTSSDLSGEWVESVLVMEAEELNTPTLAVRTDKEITTYQIGGVRPSLPVKGQVWCLVENDRITSIQIYNGSAWEGCDGRIWTGSRWIPASSYNVITLQDMYDIADATQDFEYIYTESGFWTWWQKSWNAFTEKLFVTLEAGGTGTGSGDVDLDAVDPEQDPDEEDAKSFLEFLLLVVAGGKSVVSGTRELFSGVVSSVPGTMDDLTDAFDSGGIAVGVFDGSSMDPDAADLSEGAAALSESEVQDPWRYR